MTGTTFVRRFFLEEVATEFDVQGPLNLIGACVAWDADLRTQRPPTGSLKSFRGTKWQDVNQARRSIVFEECVSSTFDAGAPRYRDIRFRKEARMIRRDCRSFYDKTFEYLRSLGMVELGTEDYWQLPSRKHLNHFSSAVQP